MALYYEGDYRMNCTHEKCLRDGCKECCYCGKNIQNIYQFKGYIISSSCRPRVDCENGVQDLNAIIEIKYSCNFNYLIPLDKENRMYKITMERL